MTGLSGSKGGCEKFEGLVWVGVEGDGSKSANSSGVSKSELLNCEMVLKTEISELVSELVLDGMLITGKSGGGKAKSGIIGTGFWRLAGWEFERWRAPICRLIVG